MNRLSKVVAVASVVGASSLAALPASAGWFGMGPFGGFGWGPSPVPVGAVVPPPYLWRVGYGVPPYGPVPPLAPPPAYRAAPPSSSPAQAPAAKPAPAPEKSESKAG